LIEVENLTKFYGNFKAVDSLTFQAKPGEILGLLGPNGAGKTTIMRILTGYIPASEGTCRIGGDDIFQNPIAAKRRIGYLPELVPLYPELTVKEYLRFVIRIRGKKSAEMNQAVCETATRCGLEDALSTLIGRLSKGYRQRVGIAQALVHDPEILILDEPTIGLDPAQIREIRELIKGLGRDHTIILSSHILPEVSQVCDRVLILSHGRILAEDTPENLTHSDTGKCFCECRVKGDKNKLLSVLEQMQILEDTSVEPGDRPDLWQCEMVLADGEYRPEILQTLMDHGLKIYEFFSRKASLEDVFLQLITEENIDESVNQGEPSLKSETWDDAPTNPDEAHE